MEQAVMSRSKTKAYCVDDLKRFFIHANCFLLECELLQKGTMPNLQQRFDTRALKRLARSLNHPLANAVYKVQWFVGVAKKIIGLPLLNEMHYELDPNGDVALNVALLTEWAASGIDRTNEVNMIVSGTFRKQQFHKAWEAAIGDREWSAQDEHNFNAWYAANITPPLPSLRS